MNNSLSLRLKVIQQDKKRAADLLKNMNVAELPSRTKESFQIELKEKYFNKALETSEHMKGVSLSSPLNDDEHKYSYYVKQDILKSLLDFLKIHQDNVMVMNFPGYILGDCKAEPFLIFIKEDGEREVRKFNLGENLVSTISLSQVVEVRFAIRVQGSGKVYLHNPSVKVVNRGKFISEKKVLKKAKDLDVIFIADEFTTRAFEPEFNTIKVSPDNWEEELLNLKPDLLFCESAWLGNSGLWTNKVGTGGPRNHQTLLNLVLWCRERGIPTVFWNKEDPFHFSAFVETARHFDFIFTTDANSVDKYKEYGCNNVFPLPFAAQPKYHNPIEKYERKEKVVFAGAYYGDKFPERTQAMDNMIAISGEHGIDIYDRNYNNPSSPNQFPDRFKQHIIGTLKGDQIERAYKGYKISLNVNSIIDSPTMFSRRVFEILASNTPVVSSESLGIENMLGELVVATSAFDKLKERIDLFFNDEQFYKKNRLHSLRTVLEKHSYKVRTEDMLTKMNFPFEKDELIVTAIGIVRSYEEYEKLMEQFNRQTFKNKKLIILLDIFEGYLSIFNKENNENVKTYLLDYMHHYESINKIIETEYFAPLHLDNYYGPNYLKDMALATLYTEETIVVKQEGKEYTYVTNGRIDRALFPVESTKVLTPSDFVSCLENQATLDYWFQYGNRFFNIDDYNFFSTSEGKDIKLEDINV